MEFISERVVGGKCVVLFEEILDRLDKFKFGLMVKSEKVKVYTIDPGSKAFRRSSSLMAVPWQQVVDDAGVFYYEGLYALVDEIKPLLTDEPVSQKPDAQTDTFERMPVEAFVKSLRADALRLWDAVKPGQGQEAYAKAVKCLKENPKSKIKVDDIQANDFKYCEKPKRAVLGNIIQKVLSANGYEPLGQNKIEELLKK
jgi:hypothetical protein